MKENIRNDFSIPSSGTSGNEFYHPTLKGQIGSDIGGRQHFAAWNSHLHTKEVLFLSFARASFSRKDQNDALQGVVGPDSCLIQLPPLDHFIMGQLDAIYLTSPWNPTPLMEPVSTS
ncbi:SNHG14 isoform 16 [Pongo abelii]|nr:SNHG14 isoform 16 [Pongo abelii]